MLKEELAILNDAVFYLQIPADTGTDEAIAAAVLDYYQRRSLSVSDGVLKTTRDIETWNHQRGTPSKFIKNLFKAAIHASLSGHYKVSIAKNYFAWHAKLVKGGKDWNGIDHSTAVRLLARVPLIELLLRVEHMSLTQISRLLGTLETSLDVPYQAVRVIASGLALLPVLEPGAAGTELWTEDARRAALLFPDSDTQDTCEQAGIEIERILPRANVGSLLQDLVGLVGPNANVRWPYLQILHYCCVPLEFFDHPASYLYEFVPRGQLALNLFAHYPAATGNPFLNNAKAVHKLDATWAKNRGGVDAHALVALLQGLEAIPYVSRRQFARLLRAWIHRIIELETTPTRHLPQLSLADIHEAVGQIMEQETNTQGILEQRAVDALSVLAFQNADWRPRGLGDSVNASNFSRHKLGDVEFANVDKRQAIALEAHGGLLSSTYVNAHVHSLKRLIDQRLVESWGALDEASAWSVEVIFVAHAREDGLPTDMILNDVSIKFTYWDYQELLDAAILKTPHDGHMRVFTDFLINPLNSERIRQETRDKFMSYVGDKGAWTSDKVLEVAGHPVNL